MALAAAALSCPNHPDVTSGLIQCARCGTAYCADCVVELEGRPYDANCKEEQVRDMRSGTATPLLASAGRRFFAMWIDGLVLTPVWLGAFMFLFGRANPGSPPATGLLWLSMLAPLVVQFIYEWWMLTAFDGQTLGKKALRIRVTRRDGNPISAGQALGRALARTLMNATQILGLVDALMVFSRDRGTLHDRAAGTVVVNWKP